MKTINKLKEVTTLWNNVVDKVINTIIMDPLNILCSTSLSISPLTKDNTHQKRTKMKNKLDEYLQSWNKKIKQSTTQHFFLNKRNPRHNDFIHHSPNSIGINTVAVT